MCSESLNDMSLILTWKWTRPSTIKLNIEHVHKNWILQMVESQLSHKDCFQSWKSREL